jgi:hypothetical protein
MPQVIVWADADGRVSVTAPAEGATVESVLASGIVPPGVTPFVIDSAALPDLARSHAWRLSDEGAVSIDESVPPARLVVPKGRVKLELIHRRLYGEVKTLALAMGETGEVFWHDFADWESDHAVVLSVAARLAEPLDAVAIHALFAAARARDV